MTYQDRVFGCVKMNWAYWKKYGKWMTHQLFLEYAKAAYQVKEETAKQYILEASKRGFLVDNGFELRLSPATIKEFEGG